ncbi:RidA family protein [Oleispirillum naphthae]|uniref:RidA family protein n=1 Tax=Oleispirillum naphthae TaxID=2838853 RepID=UPI0030824628
MSDAVKSRLAAMGLKLPASAAPVANYVPFLVVDGWIYLSGQLPLTENGLISTGRLGAELDIEAGVKAAQTAALQVIAKLDAACAGNLDRIERIVRVDVFVASAPTFFDQPKVANGASDLLVEAFGEPGRHTRNAVGMAVLPLNAPVEIAAIAKMR